jgi:predicted DCC family thiol-disulfide oxidoreductase YuxK
MFEGVINNNRLTKMEANRISESSQDNWVFFDGGCAMCSGSVRFVKKHLASPVFHFEALDSNFTREFLNAHPFPGTVPDAILVYSNGSWSEGPEALFIIVRKMRWYFRWLGVFRFTPRFMQTGLYRFIARNRIRWFGKSNISCAHE